MRKITRQAANAFKAREEFRSGNTAVFLVGTVPVLTLHGNAIAAMLDSGNVNLTLAGYHTPTAQERLNGLCETLFNERPFSTVNGEPHWRGIIINDVTVITVGPSGTLIDLNI